MQPLWRPRLCCPLLLALWAPGGAAGAAVTPVQKVIELLTGMASKGKQEKHEEQVAFAEFSTFCSLTRAERGRAIEAAAVSISNLEATIGKAEADADKLGAEVVALDAELAGWSAEKAKATAVREKEATEYRATHTDYTESIEAVDRAIATLKARAADGPQQPQKEEAVVAKLQSLVARGRLPPPSRQVIKSFLQADASEAAAPEANAYAFQSSAVLDMLEKLRERFTQERRVLEKEEMNTKHAYELLRQSVEDDTKYATGARAEKVSAKATTLAEAADAKGDLAETREGKAADEAYLQDLVANCQLKSNEYERRQALRAAEVEAIQKAVEIISSAAVAGAAETHLPSALLQAAAVRGAALLQLRSGGGTAAAARGPEQALASAFLRQQAEKAKSAFLAAIATRTASDPFEKVKKMLKDLLVRLMEEANQEADHKGWCDEQLATNKQSRDSLAAEAESLSAQVDENSALEAKLGTEISDLSAAIAELDAAVAAATDERQREKATNTATVADAKAAQDAVTQAMKVLKDFYAKAGEATALVQEQRQRQTPAEDSPATWRVAYQGMQGESKGVLGMLEVVQSDFTRLEAETSTSEDEAQRRHEGFLSDSAVDKAVKDKEMRHKGYKRESTLRILHDAKKELGTTQEELSDAMAYYGKLKPSCINTGVSYEERSQKRREEIQSLTEALRILGGEAVPSAP